LLAIPRFCSPLSLYGEDQRRIAGYSEVVASSRVAPPQPVNSRDTSRAEQGGFSRVLVVVPRLRGSGAPGDNGAALTRHPNAGGRREISHSRLRGDVCAGRKPQPSAGWSLDGRCGVETCRGPSAGAASAEGWTAEICPRGRDWPLSSHLPTSKPFQTRFRGEHWPGIKTVGDPTH